MLPSPQHHQYEPDKASASSAASPSTRHSRNGITAQQPQRSGAAKGGTEEEKEEEPSSPTFSGLPLRPSLLASLRAGPSTPTLGWKMLPSTSPSPAVSLHPPVSVRKLAAALWEIQEFPTFKAPNTTGATPLPHSCSSQKIHRRIPIQHKFSLGVRRHTRHNGQTARSHAQVNQIFEKQMRAGTNQVPFPYKNEIKSDHLNKVTAPNLIPDGKGASGDSEVGPTTSSELLNVLNRIWNLEEQYASSTSLVSALRAESDHAHAQVQELMHEQKRHRKQIDSLIKRLEDERAMWLEREQEAVRMAVHSIKLEVEEEKKSKRRLETLHKKLIRNLTELKATLSRTLQDLERERKARELMEEVCDELAREIGEDKAEVEELKRESAKVREEVEEERKMLQMAEIWREERVQMKLAEARLELEEKNAVVDKLRSELEAFLRAKRACDARKEGNLLIDKELERHRSSVDAHYVTETRIEAWNSADSGYLDELRIPGRSIIGSVRASKGRGTTHEIKEHDDVELEADDLHSIELYSDSLMGTPSTTTWSHFQRRAGDSGRRSTDQRDAAVDLVERGKKRQGLQMLGHEKARSNLGIAAIESKGKGQQWDYTTDSQWIDRTIERGEMRERACDKQFSSAVDNESNSSRQSNQEESRDHITISTRISGRNFQGSTDTLVQNGSIVEELASSRHEVDTPPDSYRSNAASRVVRSLENVRNLHTTSGIISMQQPLNVVSSPTRQWNQYWSSPDPVSPHQSGTSAGSADTQKVARDNSLKSMLLEAKLEGHKTRFGAAKRL